MPERKKILYFITKGNFGGAQRYVYDLATGLPRGEFAVTVLTGEGNTLSQKLAQEKIRTLKIDSLRRDLDTWSDIQALFSLIKILWQEQPDVLHLNSSKAGVLGSLAGRLLGIKKIILTVHGLAHHEPRPRWQKFLLKLSHWFAFFLSHQIITVTKNLQTEISTWPGLRNKVNTINNGLGNFKLFNPAVARRELLNNQSQKFLLGTIAELHHNKGLDNLIEAFAGVVRALLGTSFGWQINLLIIGEGEERFRLETLIKDKHLDGRVFLVGQIDDARAYLKALDLFVLSSRTEALPYSILEAGLAGLPVIASEVGGIPEIITSPEFGILVPPNNIEELKKSLLFMIKKKEYRHLASLNLKRQVQQNFSLKQMLEKTLDLYKR